MGATSGLKGWKEGDREGQNEKDAGPRETMVWHS